MITEKDDLLHTPTSDIYSWSETNWFAFNIPEAHINGAAYVWLHPNLRVASSGVLVWQGKNKTQLDAMYFDYRHFLPFPQGDLDDYELVNGLKIKILEPLNKFQIDYTDETRKMELHFTWNAIMPAEMYSSGAHFNHVGKIKGNLVVSGEEYKIDSFSSRDHSWGPREEAPLCGMPPFTWLVGVIDGNFAFHMFGADEPGKDRPEWLGKIIDSDDGPLGCGYVFRDGATRKLLSANTRTEREEIGLSPRKVTVDLLDEDRNEYSIIGEVTASLPWYVWPNTLVIHCQARWEYKGRTGWGEIQGVFSNENVVQMRRQER